MVLRIVEGTIQSQGTVSGTDATTVGLTEETHAIRVFLENPVTVFEGPFTVINATASGSNVTIQGAGETSVTTVEDIITISGTDHTAGGGGGGTVSNAMVGVDGITVLSGTPTASETTISGFRTEFVSASGTLQADIDEISAGVGGVASLTASGVTITGAIIFDSLNGITLIPDLGTKTITFSGSGASGGAGGITDINSETGPAITIVGAGEVAVSTTATNEITISGTDHSAGGGTTANALVGSDGITVTSGDPTDTISGFRAEFVAASGVIQTDVDTNTTNIASNTTLITTTSGHLQSEIDAVEGSDVDDVNSVVGSVVIAGAGEVNVTTAGQTITISGTLPPRSKSITIENPVAFEDITWFFTNIAITVVAVEGVMANGELIPPVLNPQVVFNLFHNTNRDLAGNTVFAASRTLLSITTGDNLTLGGDITIPIDSFIWIETTSVGGIVPEMHLTLRYTED